MIANDKIPGSIKGASSLTRTKFFPGMMLQHDDLEQLSAYARDLSRLMFRSFFGCGVVCGLRVGSTTDCGTSIVTVDCGLALDCCGDPIYVPTTQKIPLKPKCGPEPDKLWVLLCKAKKCCSPRPSMCSDEEEATTQCTRESDWFEIRVVDEEPTCVCRCKTAKEPEEEPVDPPADPAGLAANVAPPPAQAPASKECGCCDERCHEDHYKGICGCGCGNCDDGDDCECCCDCVLLAELSPSDDPNSPWAPDHRVRRFIRPVLMRDPIACEEMEAKKKGEKKALTADQMLAKQKLKALAAEKALAEQKVLATQKLIAAEKALAAEKEKLVIAEKELAAQKEKALLAEKGAGEKPAEKPKKPKAEKEEG